MAYIEDEFVSGRVKHSVEGNRELDDAEIGREMASIYGENLNDPGPDFRCELFQLS